MKKKISVLFLVMSCLSFAAFQDTLNLVPKEEAEKIEKKIEDIEGKRDIKVYVNTIVEGEGFQVQDPERSIVLNVLKGQEKISSTLDFSKDFNIEDEEDKINVLLDNAGSLLEEEKVAAYMEQILDNLDFLLEDISINATEESEIADLRKGYLFSAAVIAILLALVFYVRKKKRG